MTSATTRTRRPTFPMWAVWAALAAHGGIWLGMQADRSERLGVGSATPVHHTVQARLATQAPAKPTIAMTSDVGPTHVDLAETTPPVEPHAVDAPDTRIEQAGSGTGLDAYLSREAVDQGPQPVSLIQIPFPEGVQTAADNGPSGQVHTGRLTLYIDENGAVRRVQVNSTELPAPFQEAARNAFLQARFVPGQRQGQAVKVRIDIEVSFDDRDTSPRPLPHRSA